MNEQSNTEWQDDIPTLESKWKYETQHLRVIDRHIDDIQNVIDNSDDSGRREYLYGRYRALIVDYNLCRDMIYTIEDRLIELEAPGWVAG